MDENIHPDILAQIEAFNQAAKIFNEHLLAVAAETARRMEEFGLVFAKEMTRISEQLHL